MQFDSNNKVVQLCAKGMELEGRGEKEAALNLFQQAWEAATNDFEKFTSAHYIARHQPTTEDKLKWDQAALTLALGINDQSVNAALPSLYLNVAKCYEDLNDLDKARENYNSAVSYTNLLPDDGYGNMIRAGISNGLDRVK